MLKESSQVGGGRGHTRLETADGVRQSLQSQRFEDVVHRAMFKGGNSVRIERGHENQVRAASDQASQLHATETGQMDVNKDDLGALGFKMRQSLRAIAGFAHDLQLRPQGSQKL